MSRASLTLSICLSLGLGLTACGDDSAGGGAGSETDTDVGSTSNAPTTNEPTTGEPTTGEPTTGEPTTGEPTSDTEDPDTGSGDTTEGDTESETTGVVPEDADYRVNSLGINDPPLTSSGFNINDAAGTVLTQSLTTDSDKDGDLDLGFVLQFRPLDQSDGASEGFGFANATCSAPEDTATCDVLADTMVAETTYLSSSEECYTADPGNLSGGTVTPTAGPCFLAEYDAVTIVAGLFALPMTDVQVAATYVGDPAGNLVNGNIQGFVAAADAAAVNVESGFFTGPLTELLDEADQDGDGWIFHLSFTAVPTEWTGA